jgi:hypothetical protein
MPFRSTPSLPQLTQPHVQDGNLVHLIHWELVHPPLLTVALTLHKLLQAANLDLRTGSGRDQGSGGHACMVAIVLQQVEYRGGRGE